VSFSPLFSDLIKAFRCLPGVGFKSAQRMALHCLIRDRGGAKSLADNLLRGLSDIGRCEHCNTLSETPRCALCVHPKRQHQMLCIVETPADVLAIEQTASYQGLYYVLMGHLSPLDGIGPEELGMPKLRERLCDDQLEEIICATNPTVEGEATAHYIANMAKDLKLKITRIAHGVPLGGELEFIDGGTLSRALSHREVI
jgi:recombination protein RecR